MSETITFYHNPMSRGRIVHWMLEEVGAPYEIKLLDWAKREHKTPEYLAINPMGKIPTIVHRGRAITEAAAICLYLADTFALGTLAPTLDDPDRGTYLRWMVFGAGCVEPALLDKSLGRPPAERVTAVGWGTYENTVDALETAITPGPFVLGERFTAVDVYLGSQVGYGLFTKSLESRPSFAAYAGRTMERPAFARVQATLKPD